MDRQEKHLYAFGRFVLNPAEHVLRRDDKPVPLTPKAFATLRILVENRGHVVSKDELIKQIWPDTFVQEVGLARNISVLRKVLEDRDNGGYIETVPKLGYRFVADVRELGAALPRSADDAIAPSSGVARSREASARNEAGVTPPSHEARSIGVLPFRELGGGRENQHIGLGLADATITELASVRSLLVRPTAAILRYQEHSPDPQQAGRDLQVDAVVDGSFQRAGSRLRVTVQLVDTASGRPLWASKIDTTLDDVFTMQDEVSRRIAEALRVELTPDEDRWLERGAGPSGAAYEQYLKGRLHLLRETREDYGIAATHFETACSGDPRFAAAWAALADVYSRIAFEYEPAGGWYEKAHEACAKAFAIDPTLPEARYVRGRLLWTPPAGFDHAAATEDMIAALALRPNLDDAHTRLGIILQHVGLFEESARHLNRAVAISPGNELARGFRAGLRFHEGRFEEALERGRAISARGIAHDWVEYVIAHSLLRLGQTDEVSRRSEPIQSWGLHSTLGVLAALKGDGAEVERRVRMAVEGRTAFGHFHHTQYDIACIHALLGDRRSALEWLRQAAHNGYPCGPFFERDPFLQSLCDTGDFATLAANLESERQRYLLVYDAARSSARATRYF